MNKDIKMRLFGLVERASKEFGGVYTRIWDSIRQAPQSESTNAFLSVYANCKDLMDFVIAYEMPCSGVAVISTPKGTRYPQ